MALNLQNVAMLLEGLEETIISKLIDRAQFNVNPVIYEKGKSDFPDAADDSLFSLRIRASEEMDSAFGRFTVPEERPFCTGLPAPSRKVDAPDTGLHFPDYNAVNLTARILESYFSLLPVICQPGDDNNYGSSVEHDVFAVQAISRRIHYGSFYVAECKYSDDPEAYKKLIAANDKPALMAKLTRPEVEERIIERVRDKVAYLQAKINTQVRNKINPDSVLSYYREYIIPLTKDGEILYLLNRSSD